MNACRKVFPHASRYLCRWHISENIAKHCKASFSNGDWKKFKGRWGNLCDSSSPEIYDYNYNRLYQQLVADNRQTAHPATDTHPAAAARGHTAAVADPATAALAYTAARRAQSPARSYQRAADTTSGSVGGPDLVACAGRS
ncbi:hypothetical protein E3N88_28462 [Mikania micrantha]|uniref:Protein FAR1-RELATED SEQUENCE n=1 Tax=Mikania micrantha TaxID=192012 RepID=A0A5N6N039_9ASTR|nr:hypothetical protein E3N88_28462 [Mikania micrantha]